MNVELRGSEIIKPITLAHVKAEHRVSRFRPPIGILKDQNKANCSPWENRGGQVMGLLQITHWRQRKKGLKEAKHRNSDGCNVYHMPRVCPSYASAARPHSPFASGPDSPARRNPRLIYHKLCHARRNEYLSGLFKLLFL